MDSFWSAFAPNVAATVVGIILGLPVALWLSRLGRRAAERQQRSEAGVRLRTALSAVLAALGHNQQRLATFAQTLQANQVPFDIGLDLSAWDACRDEIVPFLMKPDLQARLSHHFGRLASLSRLGEMYLDLAAGVGSAVHGAAQTRVRLASYLAEQVRQLVEETERLITAVRELARGGSQPSV